MPAEGPLVHDHEEKAPHKLRNFRDQARRDPDRALPATLSTDYEMRTGGETNAG